MLKMIKNKSMIKIPKASGFTLIELLIVIAIIGILAAVVAINLDDAQSKSRDARRKSDLNTIAKAVQLYREEVGNYVLKNTDGHGGAYDAGYGFFNCGSDDPCPTNVNVYNDPSLNKVLISRNYLSGTVKDPTGGKCGLSGCNPVDPYYYTYAYYPIIDDSTNGTLKASIWCVLENPTNLDRNTVKNSAHPPASEEDVYLDTDFIVCSDPTCRAIATTDVNYAVTLIP